MRRICGWCLKLLGWRDPLADQRTTHGMCRGCYRRELRAMAGEAVSRCCDGECCPYTCAWCCTGGGD